MSLTTEAQRTRRNLIITYVRSVPPWSILCLLTVLFFWRLWTLNPADRQIFAYGDFVEQFYPLRRFAAEELKAGRLPLWNPHIYAGTPALADPQWAALYPPAWISALIPPWPPFPFAVLQAEAALHIALAGIFTFVFARRHLPVPAALLSAIVYAFGGYLTSYPPLQLAVLETATWLPLCLWAAERLAESHRGFSRFAVSNTGVQQPAKASTPKAIPPSLSRFTLHASRFTLHASRFTLHALRSTLYALPLALAFLAGHPQTFLFILYVSIAYYLVCAGRNRLAWRRLGTRLLIWGLAVLGLTAGQWLPTLELARLGPRLVLSYSEAAVGFSWRDLAHIILPGAWGVWSPLYVGAAPLLLAAVAITRGRERFWLGLALVGLLLSLGAEGGLYWLAYHVAPGFNLFRHQERAALLWSFALAMLAGEGLSVVSGVSSVTRPARRFLAALHASRFTLHYLPSLVVGALAIALLALWTWRGQPGDARLALWTSLAVYSAVMLGVAAWLIGRLMRQPEGSEGSPHALRDSLLMAPPSETSQSDRRWPLVALVGLVALDLFSMSGRGLLQTPPPDGYFAPNPIVWAIQADTDGPYRVSSEGLLPPGGGNGAVIWRLEDVVGNSPLHLAAHDTLLRDVPELVWWRLLNVRYVVTQRDIQHGALAEVERVGEARLYRLAGSLPRAWVTPGLRRVADDAQVRAALADPAFDPQAVAITADPSAAAWNLPTSGASLPDKVAEVTRLSPTALTVTVDTSQPGVLILSEAYAPGWRAWVNGQPSPVSQVNGLLRATPVPSGVSTVEWRYEPWTVRVGLIVSGLTLLVCLMAAYGVVATRS